MKQSAKIAGMENRDLGRIHAQTRETRPKRFQIENDPQKGGYYNGLSECESVRGEQSKPPTHDHNPVLL